MRTIALLLVAAALALAGCTAHPPSAFHARPSEGETSARIIDVQVLHNMTLVQIDKGSDHGLSERDCVVLHRGDQFLAPAFLVSIDTTQSVVSIRRPTDSLSAEDQVWIIRRPPERGTCVVVTQFDRGALIAEMQQTLAHTFETRKAMRSFEFDDDDTQAKYLRALRRLNEDLVTIEEELELLKQDWEFSKPSRQSNSGY